MYLTDDLRRGEIVKCATCNKKLQKGDKVYVDGYFFDHHCSWKHLVEYMANFFRVSKEDIVTLKDE